MNVRNGSKGLTIELLEARRLLSAGATLDGGGILTVTGTDDGDFVVVCHDANDASKVNVTISPAGPVGEHYTGRFDAADVRGIVINGLGGNDYLRVLDDPAADPHAWFENLPGDALNVPVAMYGGDGWDNLFSRSGANDTLVGGDGFDTAYRVDGDDTFGVELVENLRDKPELRDANGNLLFGDVIEFAWHGDEDALYADPYDVFNENGAYWGDFVPASADEGEVPPPGDDSAPTDDEFAVLPPPAIPPASYDVADDELFNAEASLLG